MEKGTIKKLIAGKGFGFISREGGAGRIFSYRELRRSYV